MFNALTVSSLCVCLRNEFIRDSEASEREIVLEGSWSLPLQFMNMLRMEMNWEEQRKKKA